LNLTRTKLLLVAFTIEGAVLGAALLLAHWRRMDLGVVPDDIVRESVIGLAATLPVAALFHLVMSDRGDRINAIGDLKRVMLQYVRPLFLQARFVDLLLIAAAAGVSEEMLFRGVIQPHVGLVPASILFGLLHFVTPAYAVAATLMGIYIGLTFQASDSLFAVIVLHTLYDLYALAYIKYRAEPTDFDR
jgi:membrane protease YdiL (CAAX protease family)